jgi:hypothetical protein
MGVYRMSAITEALNELKGIDTKDKADRQQLRRRARRHAESDVKGSMGWFSSLTAGGVAEPVLGYQAFRRLSVVSDFIERHCR